MNYSIIFTEISFSPETSSLHHNLAFLFAVVQLLHLTEIMNDTVDIAQASQVSKTATSGYRL